MAKTIEAQRIQTRWQVNCRRVDSQSADIRILSLPSTRALSRRPRLTALAMGQAGVGDTEFRSAAGGGGDMDRISGPPLTRRVVLWLTSLTPKPTKSSGAAW